MKTIVKCYKHSLADDPFLVFDATTPNEMIEKLANDLDWHDFPNDIWVKIGSENSLLYDPMLDIFKDWNGCRWANIDTGTVIYYFTR